MKIQMLCEDASDMSFVYPFAAFAAIESCVNKACKVAVYGVWTSNDVECKILK
ncbi:hypothetical protein SDJN02_09912, partial [Cucurbita argyrosperma subsp. argyrosperma]